MARGHNAFNGFYSIQEICIHLIRLVEEKYEIKLPRLKHWFLQRIDITKTFDLEENSEVCKYINNLNLLSYPRRNKLFYKDRDVYFSGTTTTLKIYNKLLEFNDHDKEKLSKFNDFNLFEFIFKIRGYVRFECEIKKKKLITIYQRKNIRVENIRYKDLEKVWSDEFMKILKFKNNDDDMKKIVSKDEVKKILYTKFKACKANRLYNFFISLLSIGYDELRKDFDDSTFYRNIKELKSVGVDFSQSNFSGVMKLDFDNIVNFNPFTWKEVI